tara:strand:- start:2969 stop:3376 length:408 start_codon:yes stop_codon:yes gene_type:complete
MAVAISMAVCSGAKKGRVVGAMAISDRGQEVRLGNVSVSGGLGKNLIRRFVRRKLPRIRHCYNKELADKPKLSGTIVAQFEISPAGDVQEVTAKGMDTKRLESCVATSIKSIQFPKPKKGVVRVRYPFSFRPGAP